MDPKVMFIHGTGVRDVSQSITAIRDGVFGVLGWDPARVFPIEEGSAVAVTSGYRSRVAGVMDSSALIDEMTAVWELLLADPRAELRIMAVTQAVAETSSRSLDPRRSAAVGRQRRKA